MFRIAIIAVAPLRFLANTLADVVIVLSMVSSVVVVVSEVLRWPTGHSTSAYVHGARLLCFVTRTRVRDSFGGVLLAPAGAEAKARVNPNVT